MQNEQRQLHWQNVYQSKGEHDVSWFQDAPTPSLELMTAIGVTPAASVIDIGGGASRLVDHLIERGFRNITVLDLSDAALAAAKARLGDRADRAQWIVADVTQWKPTTAYDVWHDRAAFHFLTDEQDRAAYVARLKRGLKAGGHAIIATFALDGPERCSGLPVVRYSPESLRQTLGSDFTLVTSRAHAHATPWGSTQSFQFSAFLFGTDRHRTTTA
jgi:SAM-dependent methyltransferase